MSFQVEEKISDLRQIFADAESELVNLKFDNEQLRKENEDLQRELALAQIKIEQQAERLQKERASS